jgi:mannose-1-phosphate guanylyltransferase/mannose-6-phosphate isomerase
VKRGSRRRSPAAGRFHVVLLAGGSGTRFWPLSRTRRPKQFLALASDRSLLRQTWERVTRLAPASRIWVVAPRALSRAVRRELPHLRSDRLILEPAPRDTAPAIALACASIAREDPEAIVGVFPTDHVVQDASAFVAAVDAARREAEAGSLVCLGVRPDRPATGFGYLKISSRPRGVAAVPVERFVEKPDARRARRFLASGKYLWNGGMFVWGARVFLDELARVAPEIRSVSEAVVRGHAHGWARLPKASVDFAVMEKARRVAVVPLDAGWDDVGSWDAAARLAEAKPGPRGTRGTRVILDGEGSVIFGGKRLVAVLGVRDVVVVDTVDALLVVSRSSSEAMREMVRVVREAGREDLL